jgi:putative nucleotidyltransferase with HDIG domain
MSPFCPENLDAILALVESANPTVAEHCRRVAGYAIRMASQYGLPQDLIETIRVGSLLHDAGKILVPARLLTKPGRLNRHEWATLRHHPQQGLELIERLGVSETVASIVIHHHERWDGRGYPDRLEGVSIPWVVRLVSVMDAFDALTSPRAYREALSVDAARSLIAREAGQRYCPWIVSGFLSLPRTLLDPERADHETRYVPDGCPAPMALAATKAWPAVAL